MNFLWSLCCFFLIGLSACSKGKKETENEMVISAVEQGESMSGISKLEISSPAFSHQGKIPSKYTCDGENSSPALVWKNAPSATQSFALICQDPDAPHGTFVHWVLFNIPANVTSLAEGAGSSGVNGMTSFDSARYGGPCPPSGTHRYFFKIYALDTMLDLPAQSSKEQLLAAMKGHILAQGELMGTYQRQQ